MSFLSSSKSITEAHPAYEVTSEKLFSFLTDSFFFFQLIFLGYLVTHQFFQMPFMNEGVLGEKGYKTQFGWTKLIQDINFLTDLEILLHHERLFSQK